MRILQNILPRKTQPPRRQPRTPSRPLGFELLEDRCLLATVTQAMAFGDPLLEGERLAADVATVEVAFSDELAASGPGSVTDPGNWRIERTGVPIPGGISSVGFAFDAADARWEALVTFDADPAVLGSQSLPDGEYRLIASGTITDTAGNFLNGDGDGTPGGDFTRSFLIANPVPLGPEFRVNTYTTDGQTAPAVAMDGTGNFVVVWTSAGQDGSGQGIYAQRFDADGNLLGPEFLVNRYTAGDQHSPAVARDAGGGFVVVWASAGQDGSGAGVYGQRFDSQGNKVGTELLVNTYTTGDQHSPAVASDPQGSFVVAWTSYGQDGSAEGVYGQRFDSSGRPAGLEFQINDYSTNVQDSPSVAMDADGDFVVLWYSDRPADGVGIYARRYDAAGNALGAEFLAADDGGTPMTPFLGRVAMDADGDFVVLWNSQGFSGKFGMRTLRAGGQRFDSSGNAVGERFVVYGEAPGQLPQRYPAVAMDADGDIVASWAFHSTNYEAEVYTQRYDAAGSAAANGSVVNTFTSGIQSYPSVAVDADGDFVVVWVSDGQDGSGYGVYAQRFGRAFNDAPQNAVPAAQTILEDTTLVLSAAGGNAISISDPDAGIGPLRVSLSASAGRLSLADSTRLFTVAGDGTSALSVTGPLTAINAALDGLTYTPPADFFGLATLTITTDDLGNTGLGGALIDTDTVEITVTPVPAAVAEVSAFGDPILEGERLPGNLPAVEVAFDEELATWGTGRVTDPGNWRIERTGVPIPGGISLVSFAFDAADARWEALVTFDADPAILGNQPLPDGEYRLIASGTITDTAGNPLDGDGDGTPGGDFTRSFLIANPVPVGPEFRVNNYTTDGQMVPAVAMDGTGNFVVVWISYGQDGSTYGIYAQRHDAAGNSLGVEFRVNTYTTGWQEYPSAAMDADGNFVIAWHSFGQDTSSVEIYAQRFDAAGNPFGAEFRVNTHTTNQQLHPSVAMDADGDFVIAWHSWVQDGWAYGVYAQRFDAAGNAVGTEFRVNTYTTNHQLRPSVAMDADGDFVIAWISYGQDGSNYGIYAQRYDAAGNPLGGEFGVNTYTTSGQSSPSVAMAADGDFVVAWTSWYQDDGNGGVYAHRYDAAGNPLGAEFRVNTYTTGWQSSPSVAMDADGDFVVAWVSAGQDADLAGIYAQRYDAAGNPLGAESRVNTYTTNQQLHPSLAMDPDGDFVVAWTSDGQDGSGFGVYARRFGRPVNDAPQNTVPPAQTVLEDTALVFSAAGGNPISISDPDAGTGPVRVSLSASAGRLSLASSTGLFTAAGDGTSALSVTGTLTAINAALDGLTYTPPADFFGLATLTITTDDLGNTGLGGPLVDTDTIEITVTPVPATVTEVSAFGDPILDGERLAASLLAVEVAFDEELATWGTGSVTDPGNWRIERTGVPIPGGISSVGFAFDAADARWEALVTFDADPAVLGNQPLPDGEYRLIASGTITDTAGNFLDGDGDGTPGGDFTRSFLIANPVPVGPEFRVNTYTTNWQRGSSTAVDADGDFVVTWHSYGQDGSGYGVYAQRYDRDGSRLGGEFRVNTYTTGWQSQPSVAIDAQGDFVVAWHSSGQDNTSAGEGPGGRSHDVYAQRYDRDGNPLGREFRVNSYTLNDQLYPSMAMNGAGDFVVAWHSGSYQAGYPGQEGGYGTKFGIYAQRYDRDGNPLGSEFHVNTFTTSAQAAASVAMDAAGDFVIAWTSQDRDYPGDWNGVYAQRYDRQGNPQGSEFRVNTHTTQAQQSPTVAMSGEGEFVIAWEGIGGDGNSVGIYAQRYDRDGSPLGNEFRVNTYTPISQEGPSAAVDGDGDFVIVWSSYGRDGGLAGVSAQRYDRQGNPQGSEFLVNTYTTSHQGGPAVAVDADGDFVVAWASLGQDGGGFGVYAQRFGRPVNDAPQTTVPGAQTVLEDTALVFSATGGNAISVSDPDAGIGPLRVSLSASAGRLSLAGSAGLLTVVGAGTSALSVTGPLTAINAALDGLIYTPPADFFGLATLTITTDDLGNTGVGGPLADTDTIDITVTRVNDAPINGVPGAQTTDEDAAIVFSAAIGNAISVSDVDAGDSLIEVALAATNGTLSLSRVTGLAFTVGGGSADAAMTFRGAIGDVNAALDRLVFTPVPDFAGPATITITTNDLGNTGAGGPKTDSDTIEITVTPVNDAPVVTAPQAQTTDEDTVLVFSAAGGNAIGVADVDAAGGNVRVTLPATGGTLRLSNGLDQVTTWGDGGAYNALTIIGTVDAVNQALEGMAFIPFADHNGLASVAIHVDDLGNSGEGGPTTGSASIAIEVAPVNDAPVNRLPGRRMTAQGEPVVFARANGNLIDVFDIEVGQFLSPGPAPIGVVPIDGSGLPGDLFGAPPYSTALFELTVSAAYGTFSLSRTTGLSFTIGDGTEDASMTFRGTLADINAALDGLVFTPTAGFLGVASLQITTNDLGNTGAGGEKTDTDAVRIFVHDRRGGEGLLDPSFDADGRLTIHFGYYRAVNAVAVQPDGRILVGGWTVETVSLWPFETWDSDFFLARYNVDGTLDASFGIGGVVVTDIANGSTDGIGSLFVTPDGRIVALGESGSSFAAARYRADGSLDVGFGDGGVVTWRLGTRSGRSPVGSEATVDASGRIVFVQTLSLGPDPTNDRVVVARLGADGRPDLSFGTGGSRVLDPVPVAEWVGWENAVSPRAEAVAIRPDGGIVVGSTSWYYGPMFFGMGWEAPAPVSWLTALDAGGEMDARFGDGGHARTTSHWTWELRDDVLALPDGSLLQCSYGEVEGVALTRYRRDGSRDLAFGMDGTASLNLGTTALNWQWGLSIGPTRNAVRLQPDGKILVAWAVGWSHVEWPVMAGGDFGIARLLPDGSLDSTFGDGGVSTTDFGALESVDGIAIAPDGRTVVLGYSRAPGLVFETFPAAVIARYGLAPPVDDNGPEANAVKLGGGSSDPAGGDAGPEGAELGPRGNNGLGNGLDPQPPGDPPVNDGAGTGPGQPGARVRTVASIAGLDQANSGSLSEAPERDRGTKTNNGPARRAADEPARPPAAEESGVWMLAGRLARAVSRVVAAPAPVVLGELAGRVQEWARADWPAVTAVRQAMSPSVQERWADAIDQVFESDAAQAVGARIGQAWQEVGTQLAAIGDPSWLPRLEPAALAARTLGVNAALVLAELDSLAAQADQATWHHAVDVAIVTSAAAAASYGLASAGSIAARRWWHDAIDLFDGE